MALTKCKECGNDLSTTAAACPNCGHKPHKNNGCLVVIMAFVLMIVLGQVINACNPSPPPPPKTAEQIKADRESSARGACMETIKKFLHDPDSAEFQSGGYAQAGADDIWTVQRVVRAKNAFGAYRLSTMECQLKYSEGQWYPLNVRTLGE